jgi:GNAT superfamily N-acetyltransferase
MQVTVRPASQQDANAVAEVLCGSRREHLAFAPMAHTPAEVRQWIAEILIPGGGVYVATHDDQVVAMLAISSGQEHQWIDQLYVMPGHTGQGVGAQLLQAAHDKLKPPIRLYTFQANAGARRFYERHGYKAIALTDGAGNEERCPDVLYEWGGTDAATMYLPKDAPSGHIGDS